MLYKVNLRKIKKQLFLDAKPIVIHSFFSGGSLKISLTFFKVRFFMIRGFGPKPFIFRFFMFESFIVIIFVLVFFSDMLPLYFSDVL
jgi:hypothetical protein